MGSMGRLVAAGVLGVVLAAGAATGIVSVAKQTPDNTKPLDPKTHPQIVYGNR